ncbi:hypothetical protein CFN78_14005 [Amycolatopsis antarctica]|uniref:Uncharacterized protein n=1 Tax=Amycolatopsis antarctica TaxID=1854586 RepID=A0A263D300_9PSEU|nr:hypothetical protein [Amycolatopsis antarctica]OZM72731.1 hypothetical protein CFN78_14005 [Amycolatopsis antarctica]
MRKNGLRIGAASFIAATAVLTLPVTSYAEEPPPVLAGDCESLVDENGQPIEVDAGALANAEDSVDVGLAETGEESSSLLTIPVDAVTSPLGGLPIVGDTVKATCDTGQGLVNGLAAPVQGLLGAVTGAPEENPEVPDPEVPGPEDPEQPGPEDPEQPEQPGPEDPDVPEAPGPQPELPGGEPGGDPGQGSGPDVQFPELPDDDLTEFPSFDDLDGSGLSEFPPLTMPGSPLPPAPVVPPVQAPDLNPLPSAPAPPDVRAQDAGSAEAIPAQNTSTDRFPQLLAVLALAVVIVALVRTWIRRRAV